MRTIIVEDEDPALQRMKGFVQNSIYNLDLVGMASTGEEALKIIKEQKPELIFLDIQLPDQSGFEILRLLHYDPMVIFTTAYHQFAIQAFDHFAIDYLIKPIIQERLDQAINKIKSIQKQTVLTDLDQIKSLFNQLNRPQHSSLTVKVNDKIKIIPLDEISYLKAEDKYSCVYTDSGNCYLINKSLIQMTSELPTNFIRVHRSYIVNQDKVIELEKHFKGRFILKMKDAMKSKIRSGENYLKEIKMAFRM